MEGGEGGRGGGGRETEEIKGGKGEKARGVRGVGVRGEEVKVGRGGTRRREGKKEGRRVEG